MLYISNASNTKHISQTAETPEKLLKVRCIKLIDAFGKLQVFSSWLTLGKVYHVLEVVHDTHGRWLVRLVGDGDDALALFQLDQFEIVSSKLPDSWIVDWDAKGEFTLTPSSWNALGFWERFYDGEAEAVRIFELEKNRIVSVDP